ncbi:hypothetical protein PBV87_14210 [Niameybacter massiliensis]|uniref:DUF4367 domain-containing protein n=1 Tax=Holtiella tumoricola TaxID=3018743 RepID=A0AA42DQ04_9FIRM|nr:hypothetical protein [Holtiella tumoricola]MDA3732643.1 hypothetical protein [Holtiella tumoricola]
MQRHSQQSMQSGLGLGSILIAGLVFRSMTQASQKEESEVVENEQSESIDVVVDEEPVERVVEMPIGMPNPIIEYATLEELEAALPFTLKLPTIPSDYMMSSFSTIDGHIAQVVYTSSTNEITYRMAEGTQDISGDYTDYPLEEDVDSKWDEVTLKGDSSGIYLAVWTDSTYTYSIRSQEALNEQEMMDLVESIG